MMRPLEILGYPKHHRQAYGQRWKLSLWILLELWHWVSWEICMVGVWEGWVGGYGCSLIPLCVGCTYKETYAQDIMFIIQADSSC